MGNRVIPDLTEHEVITALRRNNGIVQNTANELGISRITLWRMMRDNSVLRDVQEEATEVLLDRAESHLYSAINEGDLPTVKWYLERKGRIRGYANRVESNVNVTNETLPELSHVFVDLDKDSVTDINPETGEAENE